ncbi:MAG: response regulator [Clostridiales bacterium]|nr:response regulator [Clostridiales bacterium]
MYKVFLVDDEIAIREGIRNSQLWVDSDYILVGEAPDGEIALPMLQDERPDILITDIRMPFMDGMQLCSEVKRLMPWMKIIILSGYDDFNYARKAMNLGVQEYLLKPVSAKDLQESLNHVSQTIDQERLNRSNLERMQIRFTQGNRLVKEKLLSAILLDPPDSDNAEKLLEQLRSLGINLVAKCYAVIDFAYTPQSGSRSAQRDVLYSLAQSNAGTVHLCNGKHGSFAIVLGDNQADIEERTYAFARSATSELERMNCTNIIASIGETVVDFTELAQSVNTARHIHHALKSSNELSASPRIMGIDELADVAPAAVDLNIRPMFEQMQYANTEEIYSSLQEYAQSLGSADIHSAVAADYFHVEALMTAVRIVREAGGDPKSVLKTEAYEQRLLMKGDKTEKDLPAASELLRQAIHYRDAHDPSQNNAPVARARAYLAQHFADPTLMLQDVSEFVGMSNSRFSTVFAQKTGNTFTEHLTALRISKAQELLHATDMRSSQIAYAVGYNDPHYFSYLFKKNTSMTPSEYRKSKGKK